MDIRVSCYLFINYLSASMVQLVQRRQQRFSRKRNIIPKIISYSAPVRFIRRSSKFFLITALFVVFVLLIRYIFFSTVFSSAYTIKSVRYDSGSVGVFDDPRLYSAISQSLSGKNYYMTHFFGENDIYDSIHAAFPFVTSVDVFFLEKNTAAVSIHFADPLLVLVAGMKKFAVYDTVVVPLYPQNTLGTVTQTLQLADYTTGLQNLDGIFFKLSPRELLAQLQVFDTYFKKPYHLVFFPGIERTQITTADGKLITLNNL